MCFYNHGVEVKVDDDRVYQAIIEMPAMSGIEGEVFGTNLSGSCCDNPNASKSN